MTTPQVDVYGLCGCDNVNDEQEVLCIVCPTGCTIKAKREGSDVVVEGALCPRGVEYAKKEVLSPVRRVMTVIKVRGGNLPTVSVITRDPIPKDCIWKVVRALVNIEVEAPIEVGQVILRNICGTDVVATRQVKRVSKNDYPCSSM